MAIEDEEYEGALVVEEYQPDCHYMDKIVAVESGNGIGSYFWKLLNGDADKVIWRTSADNPNASFYEGKYEGMQKIDDWLIYWYGLDPEELKAGINYALSKKPTVVEKE